MANDKDVKIGIKTVGDTSGADEVLAKITQLQAYVDELQREMDEIEARKRVAARDAAAEKAQGGALGVNLTGTEKASDIADRIAEKAGFGEAASKAKQLMNLLNGEVAPAVAADAAVIATSFAAIGTAAVKSYQMMDETVTGYKALFEEAKQHGIEIGPELQQQVADLESMLAPIKAPFEAIKEGLKTAWKYISDPAGELSGKNALEEAIRRQIDATERLKQLQLSIANETGSALTQVYGEELQKIKEQEAAFERIGTLRAKLAGLANQAAQQKIQIAKQDGGDVALAEAQALATRLQGQITGLNDNLREAEITAREAQTKFAAADSAYNRALTDHLATLDPKAFDLLDKARDAAESANNTAKEVMDNQRQLFAAAKENILRGAESDLIDLQENAKGEVSKAAVAAQDGILQTLRDELAKGPVVAVEKIEAATQPVTDAAANKATEVKESISQAASDVKARGEETVQSLEVFKGQMETRDSKILSVLDGLGSSVNSVITRLSGMEQTVAALQQRAAQ